MTMGLVQAARQIESYGRGPDRSLAHISPDESAMLDYMQGGRRVNPVTGLAEYGAFGNILKAVAKIGASTVGFMYGGPLGAAAASAAVSKLTGDSWKSALTTGAISGLTSGLGSYASGTRGLSDLATTTGNEIAAKAAAAGAMSSLPPSTISSLPSAPTTSVFGPSFAAPASSLGPSTGFYTGLQNAGSALPSAGSAASSFALPAGDAFAKDASFKFLNSAAMNPTRSLVPVAGTGLSGSLAASAATVPSAAPAAATGFSALGSNIMNAGYGVAGAGLGAAIPNQPRPAAPLPMPDPPPPYDPNNIFPWMRSNRGGLLPGQSPVYKPAPMPMYDPNMGYADGGDVAPAGMGLPPSAAMPQLMSAALTGYMNARGGGRINGAGDGKSDDIPAMLSVGEHVIDAATVSDLGNGDNNTGHKRIEEMKQKIRNNAGRKNPRKASPKQKGLGLLLQSARA